MRRLVTLLAIGLASAAAPAIALAAWAPYQRTLDSEASRAWSSSGRWVAIRGDGLLGLAADGSGREAFRVSADYLSWAPTGDRLVWAGGLSGPVFLLDLADGTERLLGTGVRPVWSPDGRAVAVERQGFQSWDIVVLGVAGGERVLARGPVARPAWSPDGTEVGYTRYHTGCDTAIESVRPDGTGGRVIIASPEDGFIGPWWSPQGDRMLVVGRCSRKVVVVDRDGSDIRVLSGVGTSFVDWQRRAEWSPDGRWVAVRTGDGATLAEVDGGGRITVPGWGSGWAPSGGMYAYWGIGGIGVVYLDGTHRTVASGSQPAWSPDGRELAYERDAYPWGVPRAFHVLCGSQLAAIEVATGRSRGLSGCQVEGGSYADVIEGTDGPDAIYALPGPDRVLAGAGNDVVWAGPGKDVVVGGAGLDRLVGGAGRDRLDARDGEVDAVSCGPGRDVALADAKDAVSRNCESVRRR